MSERNQLRLSQICLLLSIFLHWLVPEYAAYLAPFLFAYMGEFAIKVVDDIHMPFQDFHALIHIALTLVFGGLLWVLSMYVIGQELVASAIWFWPSYLITAFVLNKFDFIWTQNEAKSKARGK